MRFVYLRDLKISIVKLETMFIRQVLKHIEVYTYKDVVGFKDSIVKL